MNNQRLVLPGGHLAREKYWPYYQQSLDDGSRRDTSQMPVELPLQAALTGVNNTL